MAKPWPLSLVLDLFLGYVHFVEVNMLALSAKYNKDAWYMLYNILTSSVNSALNFAELIAWSFILVVAFFNSVSLSHKRV